MVTADLEKLPGFFIDRDGVINKSTVLNGIPTPPRNSHSVELIDGVAEAIDLIIVNGIVPVVITNQPDVSRGTQSQSNIEEVNNRIRTLTGLEYFYVCYHDEEAKCKCRKPKSGLITKAAEDLGIDIQSSYLIGDRWKDIGAGHNAGVKETFFIDYDYPEKRPTQPFTLVGSLLEASQIIINERGK
jgi:D-glycero-D-manno-heptose 1,7-bisphosphate phosphatase